MYTIPIYMELTPFKQDNEYKNISKTYSLRISIFH